MSIQYFTVPNDQQQISKIAHEMELRKIMDGDVINIESNVHGLVKVWYRDSKGNTVGDFATFITVTGSKEALTGRIPLNSESGEGRMIYTGPQAPAVVEITNSTNLEDVFIDLPVADEEIKFGANGMIEGSTEQPFVREEPVSLGDGTYAYPSRVTDPDILSKLQATQEADVTGLSQPREVVARAVENIVGHEQRRKHGLRISTGNTGGKTNKR